MSLTFQQSLETTRALQERLASAEGEETSALEKTAAMADFATFGMYKKAYNPLYDAAKKGLGWGVGLGVPALGVGHLLARDSRHQAEKTIDHARNQALLTALGVGGIKGIGDGISALANRSSAPPAAAAAAAPATGSSTTQNTVLVQHPQAYEQPRMQDLSMLRGLPMDNQYGGQGLDQFQYGQEPEMPSYQPEQYQGPDDYAGYKTSSDRLLQKLAAVVLLDDVIEAQVTKLAGAEQADALECLLINRSLGTRLLRELY